MKEHFFPSISSSLSPFFSFWPFTLWFLYKILWGRSEALRLWTSPWICRAAGHGTMGTSNEVQMGTHKSYAQKQRKQQPIHLIPIPSLLQAVTISIVVDSYRPLHAIPLTFATQRVRWWRSRKLCVTSEPSSTWEVQAEQQHTLNQAVKLLKSLTTTRCSLLSMLCPTRWTSSWEALPWSHGPSEDQPTLSPILFITNSYMLPPEQFSCILGMFKVTAHQANPTWRSSQDRTSPLTLLNCFYLQGAVLNPREVFTLPFLPGLAGCIDCLYGPRKMFIWLHADLCQTLYCLAGKK